MTTRNNTPEEPVPADAVIEADVRFGPHVILAGAGIRIGRGARLDAASVIGEGVEVGRGAWVRAGAVVLSSVPANAIVEGNPAKIVGYRETSAAGMGQAAQLIDLGRHLQDRRPKTVPLGVGACTAHLMRRIEDARGALTVGEIPEEVPFTPRRYFLIHDVPTVELRGEHAHRACEQFLTCISGSCRVLLDDGRARCEVTLDRPDIGIYMPAMIWGTQYRYSKDAVLLVFASLPYDPADYIRTYDDFLAAVREGRE